MMLREKVETYAQFVLRVFILLAVAFLSAITAMRFAIQGREVEVPKVMGMKAGDAQALLASRKLGMKIADRAYSDLPQDYVVRQSPPPGTMVKIQQRAQVVLSLGPQKVSVPELVGGSARMARIELLRAGLQVGEISSAYLPDGEPDQVLQQNPPPEAKNTGSPRVNLLVSLGERPAAYLMPDLVALPLGEAQKKLAAARLRLNKITFMTTPGSEKGSVISQTPPRGAKVLPGTNVELQVVE